MMCTSYALRYDFNSARNGVHFPVADSWPNFYGVHFLKSTLWPEGRFIGSDYFPEIDW